MDTADQKGNIYMGMITLNKSCVGWSCMWNLSDWPLKQTDFSLEDGDPLATCFVSFLMQWWMDCTLSSTYMAPHSALQWRLIHPVAHTRTPMAGQVCHKMFQKLQYCFIITKTNNYAILFNSEKLLNFTECTGKKNKKNHLSPWKNKILIPSPVLRTAGSIWFCRE